MKYNSGNKPIICMQTQSKCYKNTDKNMNVVGVLWHSTGTNNPNLKRYVQPSDNATDKDTMLKLIGENKNKNDWNHISISAGLNCWIGKLADGSVSSIQTMPWNFKPWGCGNGKNGSCNNGWVQFEICESNLYDSDYFNKVYKEACEITAYICKMYNLDPYGTVVRNGIKIPVILCHADSCKLGFGSNHSDILHWFSKHGKTMEDVRNDVSKLLKDTNISNSVTSAVVPSSKFKVGDTVTIISGAKYTNGKSIPKWIIDKTLYIRQLNNSNAIISTLKTGAVTGTVNLKYLKKKENNSTISLYQVKVTTEKLNIRKGAGTNYAIIGTITDKGVYTIIEEATGQGATSWLKLKSGGYISADYVKKI
jgi:hypothetical protein